VERWVKYADQNARGKKCCAAEKVWQSCLLIGTNSFEITRKFQKIETDKLVQPCSNLCHFVPDEPVMLSCKEEPTITAVPVQTNSSDELIHVHKESRLGGNICAKIVFFILLGTIAVAVGLIIIEYKGSGDGELITFSWHSGFPTYYVLYLSSPGQSERGTGHLH